jgi:hypothetical protein
MLRGQVLRTSLSPSMAAALLQLQTIDHGWMSEQPKANRLTIFKTSSHGWRGILQGGTYLWDYWRGDWIVIINYNRLHLLFVHYSFNSMRNISWQFFVFGEVPQSRTYEQSLTQSVRLIHCSTYNSAQLTIHLCRWDCKLIIEWRGHHCEQLTVAHKCDHGVPQFRSDTQRTMCCSVALSMDGYLTIPPAGFLFQTWSCGVNRATSWRNCKPFYDLMLMVLSMKRVRSLWRHE